MFDKLASVNSFGPKGCQVWLFAENRKRIKLTISNKQQGTLIKRYGFLFSRLTAKITR